VPDEQKFSSSAGAPLLDENVAGFTPGKQTVVLKSSQAKLIPALFGAAPSLFDMLLR